MVPRHLHAGLQDWRRTRESTASEGRSASTWLPRRAPFQPRARTPRRPRRRPHPVHSPRVSRAFVHRLRVRYSECDPQGVVFNAHFVTYFDIALTELWREANGPYGGMTADRERTRLNFRHAHISYAVFFLTKK